MDFQLVTTKLDLERILFDETAEPKALALSLLGEITNGFSDLQRIGEGGFAVVYKGMLVNGKVAVKRMNNTYKHEKEFHREVECLMIVKHKNVVRFLGYCADTQGSMQRHDGKFVMADVQQRLLCFEYLSKGSLDKYINDASHGLEWRTRYKIIKGICQGLHYLHHKYIVHLDLKPPNILLDDNFVPKITDFGLSRCFHEMQSRIITANIGGTLGYLAPEFSNGEITYRFDLYSLGVIIIEILTGKKGYHDIDKVIESWSNRLEISESSIQLKQVRVCAEIGMECVEFNPAKRPHSTQHIISRLDETEIMDGYVEADAITSQQAENTLSEMHQDRHMASTETTSEELSLSQSSNLFVHQTQPGLAMEANTRNKTGEVPSHVANVELSHLDGFDTATPTPSPHPPPCPKPDTSRPARMRPMDRVATRSEPVIPSFELPFNPPQVRSGHPVSISLPSSPTGFGEPWHKVMFRSQPNTGMVPPHPAGRMNSRGGRLMNRDRRYDSFKTFSGKLERQISHLTGGGVPAPTLEEEEEEYAQGEDVSMPNIDRFFAALEGPELDKLKSSWELRLQADKKRPFLLRFPISAFGMCLGGGSSQAPKQRGKN